MVDPLGEARKLGYRVVYVPHRLIREYIACYKVIYEGQLIYPPAALRLGIPLNEIWVSRLYRRFGKYIVFHELQEIKYRAKGLSGREAHLRALRDEERVFRGDPEWEKMKKEVNIAPEKVLREIRGIGKTLAKRIIMRRPYRSIEELRNIRGIGEKRIKMIRERLWCITQQDLTSYL